MTLFTPYASLAGGALIGLSAVMLMALNGRVVGASGILAGLLTPSSPGSIWKLAFMAGAVAAPALAELFGAQIPFAVPVSHAALIVGGLIVGVGVTFGSGCTSGHGVCGMARLSPRSMAATATFMGTAFATVFVIRHVLWS